MKPLSISVKEIKRIIIVTTLLGIAFSFREWGGETVDVGVGVRNLTVALVVVFISICLREIVRKRVAIKFGAETEYDLIRYKFPRAGSPLLAIISFLILLISDGYLVVSAVDGFKMKTLKSARFTKPHSDLTGRETALIALTGPLVAAFLTFIGSLLSLDKLTTVNSYLAIWAMVPLFGLDGSKILFNSKLLYIFSAALIVLFIIMTQSFNVVISLILAAVIALLIFAVYLYLENR